MKTLIISLLLLIFLLPLYAQETINKSRKEIRIEKKEKQIANVKKLIDNQSFIFKPIKALPSGAGAINLSYSFSLEIIGDSVSSYLPFYGVAYSAEYGRQNSPFDFNKPIQNYKLEKNKKGYFIGFDVKNNNDFLNFTFNIMESGSTTLNINSTNRRSISYSGIIEPSEIKK